VVQVAQEDCPDPGELHPEEPGLRKPGVSVIKLFFFVADDGTKKLECLSLAGLWVMAGTYLRWDAFSGAPPRRALALPPNFRLGWKDLPGKHSYLFSTLINYGRKSYITLALGFIVIKLFFLPRC
jgi:hypothetical protein